MMRRNSYYGGRRSGWDRDDYYGNNTRSGNQRYGSYNEGYGGGYHDQDRGYGGEQRGYSRGYSSRENNDRYSGFDGNYRGSRDWGHNSDYEGGYGREHRNWGRNSNYGRYDDDRNFFDRAGDRIRDTWNRWTDHDNERSGYPRRNDNRDEYGDNVFQRAGRRIRDTWRDWTSGDEDRDQYTRSYDDEQDYDYRRNYGNTNEWMDNRSYGRENPDTGMRRRSASPNWSGNNRGRTNNYPGYYEKSYSGRRRRERDYAY